MYLYPGYTPWTYFIYGNELPDLDASIDASGLDASAYINGGAGNDTIIGTDFDDNLHDWMGDDYIDGGLGHDRIAGGYGNDLLIGGDGYDAFSFGGHNGWSDGDVDRILDFSFAEDMLVFVNQEKTKELHVRSLDHLMSLISETFQVMFTTQGAEITVTYEGIGSYVILLENHGDVVFTPPTVVVITYGQSLAVGSTSWPDREVLSPTPTYPNQAYMLQFSTNQVLSQTEATYLGLTDLVETQWETVGSGMINRAIAEYEANGYLAPNFVYTNAAVGGLSVLELLTSSDEIFTTLADGLAGTDTGGHFAVVDANGQFWHYIDDGDAGYFTRTSRADRSFAYFDAFETHLSLAIAEAQALGTAVDPRVVLNWIQGQSDTGLDALSYDYAYHLTLLVDKAQTIVTAALGANASILASVSQVRGYADKGVSIEQLYVATDAGFAYFGIPEYFYEAAYPSKIGYDYTHLSSEGYFMAGQTLGLRMYDALTGQVNDPILINALEMVSATQILVRLSGADGGIVYDPSGYLSDTGLSGEPSNFGFGLYTESGYGLVNGPVISAAEIVATDAILLTFDEALTGSYRLFLGRNGDDLRDPTYGTSNDGRDFGGTTLRSYETATALDPTGGQDLIDTQLYEFAPVQYVNFTVSDILAV